MKIRMTKPESVFSRDFVIRISSFVILSDFGFRHSDLSWKESP